MMPDRERKQKQEKPDDGGEAAKKYLRGDGNKTRGVTDRKLKMQIKRDEAKIKDAAAKAARAEILLPTEAGFLEAEGMEKTQRFTQKQIREAVDVGSAQKSFTLTLDTFGPYSSRYSRNGRHLLLGGKLGHIALCDWQAGKLSCEFHVKETVRDVTFLHNETLYAVAQKKYVYIYDHQGIEIHCMRNHIEVNKMSFLPYHFLLASVGNAGFLKFQDTSTGKLVSETRTKLGRCDCLGLNPYNAVSLLGHSNGTVTMWSPSAAQPLVKMFCHRGPVQSLAADREGRQLATAGLDGQIHVWDLRTYKKLHSYWTPVPACSVDISQRGLLGVGFGSHVEVWKDALALKAKAPYLSHHTQGLRVKDIHFCPFEDVLGLGHTKGFSSLLVPGAGEPNFDTLEANPFETKRQRREAEVHQLLDKLQPEMIALDPHFIGTVDRANKQVRREESRLDKEEAESEQRRKREKRHARGRDKIGKLQKKKQFNVIESRKQDARAHMSEQREDGDVGEQSKGEVSVLDRFKVRD